MKKQLLIVGSYPSEEKTENILKSMLESVNNDFDVLLAAHCPVSKEIQSMVKYFVYDSDNQMIPRSPDVYFWSDYPSFFVNVFNQFGKFHHGYAVYKSIMNSLYLSNHSYESFIYVEGDAIFSKEDILNLKNLKSICEKNKKEALFFKYPNFLSSVVFYSSIDFFKNTFFFDGTCEGHLSNCEIIKSNTELENFFYKSVEHKNVFDKIHFIENTEISKYFATSKLGINTVFDGITVTNPVAMETVLRVENTQDLVFVYLNHSTDIKDTDVYVNDTFVETIKGGPLDRCLKIYPTTDEFVIRMGDRRTMKFNKNEILDPKNKSFARLK